VDRVPDFDDWPTDIFSKALLVAQFLGQRSTGYEDDAVAQHIDLENLACRRPQSAFRRSSLAREHYCASPTHRISRPGS
jgi:hypothetical protein